MSSSRGSVRGSNADSPTWGYAPARTMSPIPSTPATSRFPICSTRRSGKGSLRSYARSSRQSSRAEDRLAQGTYGISIESGKPIPEARLETLPWAERTADEQALYER